MPMPVTRPVTSPTRIAKDQVWSVWWARAPHRSAAVVYPMVRTAGPQEVKPCEAWPAGSRIVSSGTHAPRIGEYLSGRDESGECRRKSKSQGRVQSGGECGSAYRAAHRFPGQRIMIKTTRCPAELDRNRDAGCDTGSKPKDQAKPHTVANPKDDRVGHGPGKQAQGAMSPAQ